MLLSHVIAGWYWSPHDKSLWRRSALYFIAFALGLTATGCGSYSKIMGSTWHEKCGWKAEDYFDDPQVIALGRAIEANDLVEIDRLVAAGANVNAQGKGKMTPLQWAFPDNKLARFTRLLERGANPNVIIESDFNTRGAVSAGDSVTHMASKTEFPGYFEAVFAHGGDPNLMNPAKGRGVFRETPLLLVIGFGGANKKDKVQLLMDKGADINQIHGGGMTPVELAVIRRRFDIALLLLESGADFRNYQPQSNSRLIHLVVEYEALEQSWSPQQKADYDKLIKWLADHGESVDEARADEERWKSWSRATGEYRRKMDAEVAERIAREAREKAAVKEGDQDSE